MKEALTPLDQLKSVLCDPEGKCCIAGSAEDRAIVDRALQALAQPPLPVQPVQESAFGWIKQSEIAQARLYGGSVTLWLEKHDCDFPVYTTPPAAQRPIHITWDERGVRTVNGVPDDAQPVQEPDELTIAYMSGLYDGKKKRPWVGLTFAEICDAEVVATDGFNNFSEVKFARAIEAASRSKNYG